MKYIIIHGIGDTKPGWARDLYLELGCKPDDIIEINWEDNVERTYFDRFTRWLLYKTPFTRKLLDYGADVPRYFFDRRLRASVVDEVALALHLMNEPFYLVGFSLGSVIALETLASIEQRDTLCAGLITLGSPINQPVIRRWVKHPKTMDRVWINLWSASDPISSRIKVSYTNPINFAIDVGHNLEAYVAKTREILSKETL